LGLDLTAVLFFNNLEEAQRNVLGEALREKWRIKYGL